MLGVDASTMPDDCASLIEKSNFSYTYLSGNERDAVILDVLKRIDSGDFSVSGEHRKKDWEIGWQENLDQFINSNYDVDALIPKFIRPRPLLRIQQKYAQANDAKFEWNFYQVYRYAFFSLFFSSVDSIYEFGCGPGYNFVPLSKQFPSKRFYGLDWAQSAVELVNKLAKTLDIHLKGLPFDFYHPNPELELDSNSGILTICGLEQVGRQYDDFLNFLLEKKPTVCVHMEPWLEAYDEENIVDYLAIRYHQKRNYLNGFYTRLFELEEQGLISIIHKKRAFFGSLFHEGYSMIAWKPSV